MQIKSINKNKIYVHKLCIYEMLRSKILKNKKSNKKEKKNHAGIHDLIVCRLLLLL